MKKLLILLLIPFLLGAAPSRPYSYSTGNTILASEVNSDLNTLYNYMTLGVDSFLDGTIVNADVHSSANVQSDKLNLTAIAQAVGITSSGSFSNAGDFTQTGTSATFAGVTIADLGTVTTSILTTTDINGGTIDGVTIGGTVAPTVTDLGSVATADINGGTVNGLTSLGMSTGADITEIADEDDMSSDSATKLATQQSIKAYVDSMSGALLFAWIGNDEVGTQDGVCNNASLTADNCVTVATYLYTDQATAYDIHTTKMKKPANVDTLTVWARIWNRAGSTTTLDVDINNGTSCGTAMTSTAGAPEWASCSVDISGLTTGTVYNVEIELHTSLAANEAYCSQIIAF